MYITMAEVAVATGWTVKRTREFLQKHDAAVQLGRPWYTTRGLLRRAFPRTWYEVVAAVSAADTE